MARNVTIKTDREKAVLRALKALARDVVLVGIPAEAAARTPEPGETHDLNNAEIGYLNEFGAPEINLPARPHLVPGVQRALPKIADIYHQAIVAAAKGDMAGIKAAETKVGFAAVASIKNLIADGLSPPLAESTLAERLRRGVSRTNPLQDTGQYRNAITFAIRPSGGKKKGKR